MTLFMIWMWIIGMFLMELVIEDHMNRNFGGGPPGWPAHVITVTWPIGLPAVVLMRIVTQIHRWVAG